MSPWDRGKLETYVAEQRAKREKLKPVERAALAYARWQGLTAEPDVDKEAQKALLDRTLDVIDKLDTAVWLELREVAADLGEPTVVGLMRYSLARGTEQLKDAARSVGEPTPPSPGRTRRRRDRSR